MYLHLHRYNIIIINGSFVKSIGPGEIEGEMKHPWDPNSLESHKNTL